MLIKNYEINKINLNLNYPILLYGKNDGAKAELIENLQKKSRDKALYTFDETQVLDDLELFYNNLLSKSLFEEQKFIIINRVTDKFTKIIEFFIEKNVTDTLIIINAGALEKKSKLRSLFEKNKKLICVAFYPDTPELLTKISQNFLKENDISISQSNINLIINKCSGDRLILKNELKKIKLFAHNGKKISSEDILKLTNLLENHSISELVDNCLAKNQKKTISILNENNFSNEECVLICRTFLNKSKRILKLYKELKNNNNINLTISSAKPPIFWKDKEIVKQQLYIWDLYKIQKLIYNLNEIELLVKKNFNNSINFITDFILQETSSTNN